MGPDVLTRRALNRATLDRQLLLRRSDLPVLEAVDHLVGMQAQVPSNPYLGLWSRLDAFDPEQLATLLVDRSVVRIVVMRGTIHLVTADDALRLRPLMQPVLDRELNNHREVAPAIEGIDAKPVVAFARKLLAEQPLSGTQLRAALAERFPDLDAAGVAYACRNWLALVQVPPRGVWGKTMAVKSTTAESWLGRPLERAPSIDDVVRRYFAAYGPATVADVAAWSRLTGLREIVERLEPELRAFRDEDGRTLFDLLGAPRPDPDTKAPVRFLPEYDNLLLSHADRSRFTPAKPTPAGDASGARAIRGTVLHDGTLCGTWRTDPSGALWVDQIIPLSQQARSAITAEGRRMLRFLATETGADASSEVRFASLV